MANGGVYVGAASARDAGRAIPEVANAVEPLWLAEGSGVEALTRLLFGWLAGRPPEHAGADVRAVVARDHLGEGGLSGMIGSGLGKEC